MDVEMKVGGMDQSYTIDEVKETVSKINGLHHIEILPDSGIIKIDYDQEEVSLKEICNVIEELGYTIEG